MRKTYKGIFKPENPQKYKGNVDNIVYRSLWERRAMKYFDQNPKVVEWSSEEKHFIIPYICKTDGNWHRYFPDFLVKIEEDGKIVTYLVEVKPSKETRPPKKQQRKTKKYINEVLTYAKNHSKWEAAKKKCKEEGWKFVFLTEKELGR